MLKLLIDNREVDVADGATVLDAARKLGVRIPTLCHMDGLPAATSCMVCVVRIRGRRGLQPACATIVEDGMVIECDTDEIRLARRTALELLLSDHLGDCMGPCQMICPAHMDIPTMIRQIAAGRMEDAIATVKRDIALPAVLGRICPAPCQSGCRRKQADAPVAICMLKRYVADVDLAASNGKKPYRPNCEPDSGKRVAIIGAGPAGLAAAYRLRTQGHAVTVFDDRQQLGGSLRANIPPDILPAQVLDAEIATIAALGAEFRMGERIDESGPDGLAKLQDEFDAVLLAVGRGSDGTADRFALGCGNLGLEVDRQSYATRRDGVFAAGNAIRTNNKLAIRSLADGKEAADVIDRYLKSGKIRGLSKPLNVRIGRLAEEEIAEFVARASGDARVSPSGGIAAGFSESEARAEAERCLHCDCRKVDNCRLRNLAQLHQADPRRFDGARRVVEFCDQHPSVIYEPGKCIDCGLCVRITERAGEPLGLTFIGRGFDVRVGIPLGGQLADALHQTAAECVDACPTGALAWKNDSTAQ